MARPLVRHRRLAAGVAALAAVAAGACSDASDTGGSPNPARSPYETMGDALCATAGRAATGDPAGARRAFYDGAHQPLHDLAADTTSRDRATAGRLLEAKEAVEAALDGRGGELTETLQQLLPAVGDALQLLDAPALPCTTAPQDNE